MSVKIVKRNIETRIFKFPIGRRFMCMETKRHENIIQQQKIAQKLHKSILTTKQEDLH